MRWFGPVFVSSFLLSGCSNCSGSSSSADAQASDATPTISADAGPPKPRKAPTGGAEAAAKLSRDVDALIAANPSSPDDRDRLIELLLQRSELLGKPSDLVRADELSKSWPNAHFARAMVLAKTGRFEAATEELDRAQSTPKEKTSRLRFEILLGHGEYDEALAMQPSPADNGGQKSDALTIANSGFLALKMQKKDEGRKLLALATQTAESEGAPLPYAWLCYQQGLAYARSGDHLGAESWFGSAMKTVPQYAGAAVHIASAQQPNAALASLAEVAKTSDDPEVANARGAALERLGQKDDAKKAYAEATKGYDALVEKLPEAFADAAARFYLGGGSNPAKALELARKNAKARPTEDAMTLWVTAATAAKQPTEACTASLALKALPYSSDRARSLANSSCPDAGVH